jgi:hypothetical protein
MTTMQISRITCLLKLPQLRSLTLSHVTQKVPSVDNPFSVPLRSSPIHRLVLLDTYMDTVDLAQLLLPIKALKIFTLEYANWNYEHWKIQLDYPLLSQAFLLYKYTLQSLSIEEKFVSRRYTPIATGHLTWLESMHAIRYLSLNLFAVPGNELPPNVANLALTIDIESKAAWHALYAARSALWCEKQLVLRLRAGFKETIII